MDRTAMRIDNSEKGFSLIEVMIALVVLLVGMLGIMGMQYYAVSGNANSRELRMATNLGQDMIESLKSTAYGNLSSSFDTPAIVTARSSEATSKSGEISGTALSTMGIAPSISMPLARPLLSRWMNPPAGCQLPERSWSAMADRKSTRLNSSH